MHISANPSNSPTFPGADEPATLTNYIAMIHSESAPISSHIKEIVIITTNGTDTARKTADREQLLRRFLA
jgi:hypothetical protein